MAVVLITGAAGGLGRAMTKAFLKAGWSVVAGRHELALSQPEAGLLEVRLDVTRGDSCAQAGEQVMARFGRIDCLINNAGLSEDRLLTRLTEADWDHVLAVNLDGAMRCARTVLPAMARQRRGHIINISSFAARYGTVGQAAYAAAKAGLLGLTQALALEVGGCNVQVNAVLPGLLPTRMTASLPANRRTELAKANALGRLNSLAEVASFVVFLASMRDVSGQLFQLDSRIARWT